MAGEVLTAAAADDVDEQLTWLLCRCPRAVLGLLHCTCHMHESARLHACWCRWPLELDSLALAKRVLAKTQLQSAAGIKLFAVIPTSHLGCMMCLLCLQRR
jgi:hypothetical protein